MVCVMSLVRLNEGASRVATAAVMGGGDDMQDDGLNRRCGGGCHAEWMVTAREVYRDERSRGGSGKYRKMPDRVRHPCKGMATDMSPRVGTFCLAALARLCTGRPRRPPAPASRPCPPVPRLIRPRCMQGVWLHALSPIQEHGEHCSPGGKQWDREGKPRALNKNKAAVRGLSHTGTGAQRDNERSGGRSAGWQAWTLYPGR